MAILLGAFACGAPPPPDVVLVTLDTTRADHLGCYGYARDTTPNLDALARESVRFRRAWSPSPWTLPAHASLFTGLSPDAHGARALLSSELTLATAVQGGLALHEAAAGRLSDAHVTLAERLLARGYRTAAFVGGPWLERPFGLMQGFEHVDDAVQSVEGRRADTLTDAALAWLETLGKGERFFLMLNYFDPHLPYDPPPGFDEIGDTRGAFDPRDHLVALLDGTRVLDAEERQRALDRYDGEIRFADHQLGRLLDALRARPGWERALVIVTADHGEAFGEGGRYTHTYWLSEELLHVPLLVRYPARRDAGAVRDDPVQLMDVLPLVAAELGLEPPQGIDGVLPGERSLATARVHRHKLALRISRERFDRALEAAIDWPFKLVRSDRGEQELVRLDAPPERPVGDPEVTARLSAALDRQQQPPRPIEVPAPAAETQRALRELGYVE